MMSPLPNKPLQRTCFRCADMGRGRIEGSEALTATVPSWRTPLSADPLGGLHNYMTTDPIETLMLLVEAALAMAGFSGVVIVFGRRSTGVWPRVERTRFKNLLITSFSVLFLSSFGARSASRWRES